MRIISKILLVATLLLECGIAKNLHVLNNEGEVKKGDELRCILVDRWLDSKAQCYNKDNTIDFYTTHRDIKKNYTIEDQNELGTKERNFSILDSGEIAHMEMWVIKK